MKILKMLFLVLVSLPLASVAQTISAEVDTAGTDVAVKPKTELKATILYGTASYYADKFQGRQTASGELYDSQKMTAACNALPMGTWIKVTNLSNSKSVIVKTNDRLHPKMTRIVDLSKSAAALLGYIGKGLTKVKVEVLTKK